MRSIAAIMKETDVLLATSMLHKWPLERYVNSPKDTKTLQWRVGVAKKQWLILSTWGLLCQENFRQSVLDKFPETQLPPLLSQDDWFRVITPWTQDAALVRGSKTIREASTVAKPRRSTAIMDLSMGIEISRYLQEFLARAEKSESRQDLLTGKVLDEGKGILAFRLQSFKQYINRQEAGKASISLSQIGPVLSSMGAWASAVKYKENGKIRQPYCWQIPKDRLQQDPPDFGNYQRQKAHDHPHH